MPDIICNGYTNWETWLICLYSDNERRFYDMKRNMFRRLQHMDKITNINARRFATDSGLTSHVINSESEEFEPRLVDWNDVADTWTTELEEYKQYNA